MFKVNNLCNATRDILFYHKLSEMNIRTVDLLVFVYFELSFKVISLK